ncbi:MAG TPA: LysR substrate-binding domain-containing protein, partial [Anaeromyxobacteraceae bacterium]
SLVARRAAPVVLQLYASPLYLARRGVPRGEADLAGHDGVLFRSGPQKLRIPRLDGAYALRPRVVCDDLLFARDAMRAGAGIGLLPTFVAAPEVAAGALVRVLTTHERTAGYLHIVTPGGRHVSRKVTAFRDLALELLRGDPTRRRLA